VGVNRSSGSRVRFPTTVTVLVIGCAVPFVFRVSGPGGC
jgi:hypothetical protein